MFLLAAGNVDVTGSLVAIGLRVTPFSLGTFFWRYVSGIVSKHLRGV